MKPARKPRRRPLRVEQLTERTLLAADILTWHNEAIPADVDHDTSVAPRDALLVINALNRGGAKPLDGVRAEGEPFYDVAPDGVMTPLDALAVINELNAAVGGLPAPKAIGPFDAAIPAFEDRPANLIEADEVEDLLDRAAGMSASEDAIIAIVDRTGTILGVRVENGVDASIKADPAKLAFAIDGAVAKARTAAFFSSNAAPLPSRTIRYISQSTITQREVESRPYVLDPANPNFNDPFLGPGWVAPIGVGGHFPPEIAFTPQVDLFGIEHQSRDSIVHPGFDGVKGTPDDFDMTTRFNVDPAFVPANAGSYLTDANPLTGLINGFPESWGLQSGVYPDGQGRGIATLPGGVPLFKIVTDAAGNVVMRDGNRSLPQTNLVGGIGVFFPGEDGYATFEQGFVHTADNGGRTQTEKERMNAARVLEAEFIAFATAANDQLVGPFRRSLAEFEGNVPRLTDYALPTGRIDLVGITLEIFGPHPDRQFRGSGIDRLVAVGRSVDGGNGDQNSGQDAPVAFAGDPANERLYLPGSSVPEQWLVAPHDSDQAGGLSADQVQEIIEAGIEEANRTRAAIRLDLDNNFRPGLRTRMVFSVADTNGDILGLYRMPDATIFSIDVSVAKARNTAYYADAVDLQDVDRIDFDQDGLFENITSSFGQVGDTVPRGTSLTNRSIRFVVEPRFPTGIELPPTAAAGLVNDAALRLAEQKLGIAQLVGPESILQDPGINPRTAENLDPNNPLPASVYRDNGALDGIGSSIYAFDAFMPSRNFRDPGDAVVDVDPLQRLRNQNGIVFFPGSTSLHLDDGTRLVGGFGVSGDGVDQDDVVTVGGQGRFEPAPAIRVDAYTVGGVRLPFQKFNRHPRGA